MSNGIDGFQMEEGGSDERRTRGIKGKRKEDMNAGEIRPFEIGFIGKEFPATIELAFENLRLILNLRKQPAMIEPSTLVIRFGVKSLENKVEFRIQSRKIEFDR